jgi:CheY-like chemotaxis protein
MSKVVLDIGNCVPDHVAIQAMLRRWFDVAVLQADQLSDALERLQQQRLMGQSVDLILVNRKLDIDYSDGIEIVRYLKQEPDWKTIPVMLITNYAEQQQLAVEIGAEHGFGKLELQAPETRSKLERILGSKVTLGGP